MGSRMAEAKPQREAVQHDPVNVPSDAPEWARQTVYVASEPQERDETRDFAQFANDEKVGATFVLVDDVYDMRASHDPTKDFAARPEEEFPAQAQRRTTQSDKNDKNFILRMGENLDPKKMTEQTRSVTLGPPTIAVQRGRDRDGNMVGGVVIAGNARQQALEIAYDGNHQEQADALREELVVAAPRFGLDPNAVRTAANPAIYRVVEMSPMDAAEIQRLNRESDKAHSPVGAATSMANALLAPENREVVTQLAAALGRLSEQPDKRATLREFLASPDGDEFYGLLIKSGILSPTEAAAWREDGKFLPEAKIKLERAIAATALGGSARAYEALSHELKTKLEWPAIFAARILGGPEWDLSQVIYAATELIKRGGGDQVSITGPESEFVSQFANLLQNTNSADLRAMFRRWLQSSQANQDATQVGMALDDIEGTPAENAFNAIFGFPIAVGAGPWTQ